MSVVETILLILALPIFLGVLSVGIPFGRKLLGYSNEGFNSVTAASGVVIIIIIAGALFAIIS